MTKGVTTLKVGDRIALRVCHMSHAVAKAEHCYRIPDAITFEQAAWFGLDKIAFHGARRTEYQIGDRVMIIGAGPIGQM